MRFKIKCSFGGISLQAGTLERGFTVLNCRNQPDGTALSPTVTILWTAYVFFYSGLFCEAPVSRSCKKTRFICDFSWFFCLFSIFFRISRPHSFLKPFFSDSPQNFTRIHVLSAIFGDYKWCIDAQMKKYHGEIPATTTTMKKVGSKNRSIPGFHLCNDLCCFLAYLVWISTQEVGGWACWSCGLPQPDA